jgi:hypothetical protein
MTGKTDYAALLAELNSPEYRDLRPAQDAVLKAYASGYTEKKDVAIELPTGAGKSLLALLIGEVWRRENKKVAILTGNKTLARQMEKMAGSLGVPAARMEGTGPSIPASDKRAYQRTQAIGIMNYWVYFNQNPVIDAADLLIMDDAHLAEHCLHSLYSVEINRGDHKELFEAIVTELAARFPEYSVLQDAADPQSGQTTPTELLSFFDQHLVVSRIREIVEASPTIEADKSLRFRWRRLRERLEESNLYLSNSSLWFRPYIYPLMVNPHYDTAAQRLYMSATIGECADLSRRLGVQPIAKVQIPQELSSTTYGRRMLIMNKIEETDLPEQLQVAILAALRVHPKSIWLCESRHDAERFQDLVSIWLNQNDFVGQPTWILTSLGDEIDEFKNAPKGHLFVAGRFDGMDFKANECRLVILTTLPRAINAQEEFFTAYLRDSGFMLRRLNQRIVQALGRCNRDPNDFGVYVLADRRFATHFGRESNRVALPDNIMVEIDSAEDATEIKTEELAQRVTAFLNQEFAMFDADLDAHRQKAPLQKIVDTSTLDTSEAEVLGWTEMFENKNYGAAQKYFGRCSTQTQTSHRELSAFFQWSAAKASFLLGGQGDIAARSEAPDLLESAIERGGKSSWFNRLRSSLNRYRTNQGTSGKPLQPEYAYVVLHGFDDILEKYGPKGVAFQRWAERITAYLNSETHSDFQLGLEELGKVLGFAALRPRYGAATDCRWRGIFGNTREVVTFEAKIENEPSGKIVPHHVGQAHIQLTRAKEEFSNKGFLVRGTIVTHLTDLESTVASSLGEIRIIQKEAVVALWKKILGILTLYRSQWSLEDVEARIVAAEALLTRFPKEGWLSNALSTSEIFVHEADLTGDWPSLGS